MKLQLHLHVKGDPCDNIKYSAKQAIDKASKLNYKVISITCHDKVIFNQKLSEYAKTKGVLLIPGIEKTIQKKHVLIINATKDSEKIISFDDLKIYKSKNPKSFIIAAHPFHPSSTSLMWKLIKHIDLFDAIEYSYFCSTMINPNILSKLIAKFYNKPLIATSDIHYLNGFDYGFAKLPSKTQLNTEHIFDNLRKQNFINESKKFSSIDLFKLLYILNKAIK